MNDAAIREARQAVLELLGWDITTKPERKEDGGIVWAAEAWKSREEHRREYHAIRARALDAVLDYATILEGENEAQRDTIPAPPVEADHAAAE